MPVTWTTEQVLALSPDASSTKSGQELANPRKWVCLGRDNNSLWGECQGSGKNPYQTEIDLREPAFKCTCPSRKFPCKHSLGLFLLLTAQPQAFAESSPPAWVTEWLESREKREEKKAEKKEKQAEKAADPDAQAKRAASREAKVTAGMQELETWLCDLLRNGLAHVQTQPYQYWEKTAARMVDAQSPGIARALREMAGLPSSGQGWQERLLERVSHLYLLIEGYRRIESLPPDTQADIRALIGWTQDQDELLHGEGIRDRWLVVAQKVDIEEKLKVQRTWLWGKETLRPALIFSFAHGTQPLDTSLLPGICLDAELVYYPGSVPLRALVKNRHADPSPLDGIPGFGTFDEMLGSFAHALSLNPWVERMPVVLESVTPVRAGETWRLQDSCGKVLPLDPKFSRTWQLAATSGGRPVTVFGEWEGRYLLPLSTFAENRFYSLTANGGES